MSYILRGEKKQTCEGERITFPEKKKKKKKKRGGGVCLLYFFLFSRGRHNPGFVDFRGATSREHTTRIPPLTLSSPVSLSLPEGMMVQ